APAFGAPAAHGVHPDPHCPRPGNRLPHDEQARRSRLRRHDCDRAHAGTRLLVASAHPRDPRAREGARCGWRRCGRRVPATRRGPSHLMRAPTRTTSARRCHHTGLAMKGSTRMIDVRPEQATPSDETRHDARGLVWAASGLGFLACSAAGLLLATVLSTAFYPSPFGPPFGPQTDVATYFASNNAQVRGMSFVFTLAALFLLVFVAYSAGMLADR